MAERGLFEPGPHREHVHVSWPEFLANAERAKAEDQAVRDAQRAASWKARRPPADPTKKARRKQAARSRRSNR